MRNYKGDCKEGEILGTTEMVNLLLKKLHIDREDPKVAMRFSWKDIVGERFAPHIQPVDIKNNVLIVKSDHPAWSQLFLMDARKILKLINEKYPSLGIKRIAIVS